MKIVCFNINQYIDSSKLPDIIHIFKDLQADVIILQEIVSWSDVVLIAKQLGMNYNKKAWYSEGITIITRYDIKKAICVPIKNTWRNAVVGIFVSYDTPNKFVWIYSCHLWHIDYKNCEKIRLHETYAILDVVNKQSKNYPIIVGGDFNSISHLDVKNTCILPSHLFQQNNFIDTQAGKKWTRSTYMPAKSNIIERIDRIYCKSLKPTKGFIMDKSDFKWLKKWPTGRDHRLLMQILI